MKQFRAQIIMMMMMMMMMTCCFASISRANVRRTLNKAGVLPVHLILGIDVYHTGHWLGLLQAAIISELVT